MRTSTVLLLAVAALAIAAGANAQTSTKGTTLRGYTFGSDVGPYLNISRDICDIKSLLNAKVPDYTFAKGIYMDGFNGKMATKDGGLISMRRMVTDPKPEDEPTWQLYRKHFNNPVWMDDLLMRAFAGIPPYDTDTSRVQLIVKTLESSMQFSYVMRELEAAISKAKAGKLSPESGAPYSVDKAWAIFVGGNDNCGLATVALKRANEFGTKKTCAQSWVEYNVLQAMKAAQAAARKGDVAALTKAADTIRSQMAAIFIQATITYAHEMYLDKLTADKLSLSNISAAEHQVEAFAFYRTIAPLVSQANKTAGEALDFWLFPGQPVPDNVDLKAARAFDAAYKGLGVTPKDIGLYGRKQPELGCKAYVDKTTGGILSSTQAKDSLDRKSVV